MVWHKGELQLLCLLGELLMLMLMVMLMVMMMEGEEGLLLLQQLSLCLGTARLQGAACLHGTEDLELLLLHLMVLLELLLELLPFLELMLPGS